MSQAKKSGGNKILLTVLAVLFGCILPFSAGAEDKAAVISGCVYHDKNSNNTIDAEETGLAGWGVILEDCGNYSFGEGGMESFSFNTQEECVFAVSKVTNQHGCYSFSGLSGGQYRVREILPAGWSQSYPAGFYYHVGLTEGEEAAGIDFANFRTEEAPPAPVCGNGIKELNEICDGDEGVIAGYFCNSSCLLEPVSVTEVLGEAGAPNLTIGKIVAGGDDKTDGVTFRIFLANNGNMTAYNVYVTDKLPGGMVFPGSAAETKTWGLGDIAPGAIEDIVYAAAPPAGMSAGEYENTVTARASNHKAVSAMARFTVAGDGDADTGGNGGEVAVLGEEGAPALTVGVSHGARFANPGDRNIIYRAELANHGDLTAFGVKIVATLDPGLRFSGETGSSKQWMFDSMLPGAKETVDFTIDADPTAGPGRYSCVVSAGAANHAVVSDAAAIEIGAVEVLGVESEEAAAGIAPDPAVAAALPETGFDHEQTMLCFLNVILGLFVSILFVMFARNRAGSSS